MFSKKRLGRVALVIVPFLLVLLLVATVSGFATDTQRWMTSGGYLDQVRFEGLVSLEETILLADVIAVVDLQEVSRGVVQWKRGGFDQGYGKTLEYRFAVKEYLKGTGGDELVGIVINREVPFETAAGVAFMGEDPDKYRRADWDDRKAVVFLIADGKDPDLNWKTGRYRLALTDDGDLYSIANPHYRPWLPAASSDTAETTFLLEHDLGDGEPSTITLDDLKLQVAHLSAATAGQSTQYNECIFNQYNWQRRVDHWGSGGSYYYAPSEIEIASGLPAGEHIFTGPLAPYIVEARLEEPLGPGEYDQYLLAGQDAEYFTGEPPALVSLARPLPAGDYKLFHAYLSYDMGGACGGKVPDEEMQRQELFVAVTAPEGAVYEGFFNPVADGDATAAAFTDAPVSRIAWEPTRGGAGSVKATATSSLSGHTLNFIGLDGSVVLSLAVSDAAATGNALAWSLKEQPWAAGDKLMLRVSAPVS